MFYYLLWSSTLVCYQVRQKKWLIQIIHFHTSPLSLSPLSFALLLTLALFRSRRPLFAPLLQRYGQGTEESREKEEDRGQTDRIFLKHGQPANGLQ